MQHQIRSLTQPLRNDKNKNAKITSTMLFQVVKNETNFFSLVQETKINLKPVSAMSHKKVINTFPLQLFKTFLFIEYF